MSEHKKPDAAPPDARAVAAADREARIEAALSKLRYGASAPAGYTWSGELLRLR